jgi:hypothetical protein
MKLENKAQNQVEELNAVPFLKNDNKSEKTIAENTPSPVVKKRINPRLLIL